MAQLVENENEERIHTTTRASPENIMLSESSQRQETADFMIPFV